MLKDLLDCEVGKCMFCKKLKILANGMCGACLKNLGEQEQENHEGNITEEVGNEES